ncbi:MAG: Eco57I restriction-modification methylase domain-containing protein [Chloroflexi bacterium]|nr:Eco57I restriction-modification methylase domain-containing protein [Chloroflexota bacterium]MCI0646657.1 Eco57I restriction-modification methylase domain-containing protein [Chloroflexota bacterium]MCI0729237.1 Eco57I restriction-modification methylase domain-containing protein [Chloroflexota bacterium]
MSSGFQTNDIQLTAADLGQLENADQIVHFFARLGYDVDRAAALDHAALGLDSEELRQQIRRIRLVGADPVDGEIAIYLLEVRSVTVQLRQAIARRFRERPESALLVLTTDYETLDFVLLEKEREKSKSRGRPFRLVIRPRPLTVDRRRPRPVALRVLQRFTFTEADGVYQWDKLRSAYTLAEWSEPYFNNRALFSDYYLKERLADPKLTPAWDEDVRPTGREVARLLAEARRRYTGQKENAVRQGLLEPLFTALGFQWARNKAGESAAAEPDYLFYAGQERDKPIALALTYVWNRNLDDQDPARDPDTPEEIPGALVVSVLEQGDVPWVVVSNGKLWRLYSATADNKATNYYEIDLEEALAAPDQVTALKYWWLFFRRPAFTGFLDDLRRQSADYAKGLGERLKDRTFEEIFPHFAAGFIGDIRRQVGQQRADFDEEALQMVYEGTLTFLYRLMFVLYAESLELLPLNEERGYRQESLYRLKREIAEAAGTILDEAPARLKAQYTTTSTALYERLERLFELIDSGAEALNLPTYNGGLFSQVSESGEFLADYAIPDQSLALGLDRLCRDVDDKTQALVFIDYKSLGVRHLGSIYEGLLEFKLRIAGEKLAVVKEKGKEKVVPYQEAKGKIYATLEKGDVYLENDKKERKATGSYYTPDYIVKYIVEHTAGPVLERKFEELAPRLRLAQRQFRQHRDRVKARGGDQPAGLLWNTPEMQALADDCLNVRVLDPAAGSGHFLVEAVDFISNRLITFLNAWSENPVWGMLEQIRDDIVVEMERQGVTIDTARLTRVALLKRAVLKRCVYGVDLNEMAVELAKVSLWLDAFTLGAPLSFLDHHLKHGNSLIGARIKEVEEAVEGTAEKAVQLSLFSGGPFTGLSLATDLMRRVSTLSDNTVSQVQESQAAYRDAGDHLAYYKRVLDVYTSRWFGNAPGKKADPAVLFLRHNDTRNWLKNPHGRPPEVAQFDAPQVAETALQAAEDKRFFHWELEFPEVFFAPGRPGGQDVQLLEWGGFDAIIGNPPYGADFGENDKPYFSENYISFQLDFDSYIFFLEKLWQILRSHGLLSYIVPEVWLRLETNENLRRLILSRATLNSLWVTGRVFAEAVVYTCVPIFSNQAPSSESETKVTLDHSINTLNVKPHYRIPQASWLKNAYARIEYLMTPELDDLLSKIMSKSQTLAVCCDIAQGLTAYDKYRGQDEKLIRSRAFHSAHQKDETFKKWLEGGDVARYELDWSGKWISYGPWLAAPRDPKYFYGERLLFREVPGSNHRIQTQLTNEEFYYGHSIIPCLSKVSMPYDLRFILAVINSYLISFYSRIKLPNFAKNTFPKLNPSDVQSLPIPKVEFNTNDEQRSTIGKEIKAHYKNHDLVWLIGLAREATQNGRTDIIHDELAFLAVQMIEFNKQKQAEIKHFLNWLEGVLSIRPREDKFGVKALTGYSVIQNYPGDYQKGEAELPWEEFYYRLHQNRNRLGVNLVKIQGQIQAEYEKSLAVLRPIKQQLAATDALIDQIVYQLYGLTDEEIELIERPAYEQALAEAKEKALQDEELQKDPDAALEVIAAGVLPAAQRLQSRVNVSPEEERLNAALPGWRLFAGDVPTFLLTGEYNIAHLPGHLDFSTSVIAYAKAVETALMQRLFLPFREESGYGDGDCHNAFLQQFMRRERHLTLGSFPIIMASSRESALRRFTEARFTRAAETIFGDDGVLGQLNDNTTIALRNKAAHSEALSRAEAQQARAWALNVLRHL